METKEDVRKALEADKTAVTSKWESVEADIRRQLDQSAEQLDSFLQRLVAKAKEIGRDVDLEGLQQQATEHFEKAKAATAEKVEQLKAQASEAVDGAAKKVDKLSEESDDSFDDLKADATEQLAKAQVKLDELKESATKHFEESRDKAKAFWTQLFND